MVLNRIEVINQELTIDPLGRGYSGMTDQQAADDLNIVNRSVEKIEVPTYEVFESTILSEYNTLTADQKDVYQAMLSMGAIDPRGANTRQIFADLFGVATTTRANLLALKDKSVSRAE